MTKFKVSATLLTTRIISRIIEAHSLDEATRILLRTSNKDLWVTKAELKTSAK